MRALRWQNKTLRKRVAELEMECRLYKREADAEVALNEALGERIDGLEKLVASYETRPA